MLARELKPYCALYWLILQYILIFSSLHSLSRSSFLGLCLNRVDMSSSLPSDKLIEIHQLAHALLLKLPILEETTLCTNTNLLFLMWLFLLMLCSIIRPFIFRFLGFPYLIMAPILVLCTRCILPCNNSRLLHLCCLTWPFSCTLR